MNHIPLYFTSSAITLFIFLIFLNLALFPGNIFPLLWIVVSFGTIFFFFNFTAKWTRKWAPIQEETLFKKKIFIHALWIRIGYVIASYLFFNLMTGRPFEFEAADSEIYHQLGIHVKNLILAGEYNLLDKLWYLKTSSKGYVIFLGSIYILFFDSMLVARLFQALIGAWTCVLIYDLAKRSFGDSAARIAAVMAVLAPPLIYYCGLHLKEGLITFIVVAFINIADRSLRAKSLILLDLFLLMILGCSLFFFRAALAVSMFFSLLVSLLIISKRGSPFARRFGIALILVLSLTMLSTIQIFDEAIHYYQLGETHIDDQMSYYAREGGNILAKYGKATIFIPLAMIGPFPTLTDAGHQNLLMLSGSFYIKNVIMFLVFLAFIVILRQKSLRKHILLIVSFFSWIFILGNSGFALSDRFHLPVFPLILIFAGYGATQLNNRISKYYLPYLILIAVIITAWNWFKLAGRGGLI